MLLLETTNHVTDYGPGQEITGRVGWQQDHDPKKAMLRLFWYTEGKGTQDVGIEGEIELPHHMPNHEQAFSFTLPDQPYSFSGKLITLKWALELVLDKGKEVKRVDLLVSPWVKEVELGDVPEEKKGLEFKIGN